MRERVKIKIFNYELTASENKANEFLNEIPLCDVISVTHIPLMDTDGTPINYITIVYKEVTND